MDPQLVLFRRQYLQLVEPDFLAWPPKQLLRDPDVQAWLYRRLFDPERNERLPPERYQLRVVKPLLAKIEAAIEDPEEDVKTTAVQQKTYVTFSCIAPGKRWSADPEIEPTVTLLERRHLISGSLTTGFRTWEAALHLGSYLLTADGSDLIRETSVLELGAGTGFLSILSAKHLEAKHVTATDGDEGVVEALRENLYLNGLDHGETIVTSILRWGRGLKGTWVEEDCEAWPYDTVIGADITYDKAGISALVATLRFLFDMRPELKVIISGAVRNAETFETFRSACLRSKFTLDEVGFEPNTMREQTALFYATAVPLKILKITREAS
ncbi:hypothetical protein B0A55_04018 [Friedmanniomyces simplex]|uniref:FAM86 N-terminal domain-containing protein n=1 Tax=Friedmanniomyces simplex TaxID=329884 RepID=A0A4U0X4Q9_9PEZI|nr:hypothetical protein B0A55_04018 [Friedmanniomyces simplex]